MNTGLKTTMTAVAAGLVALATQWASAQSYLDGSAKARGDYGQASSNSWRTSSPMYRATAPSPVRSFSYEPSPASAAAPKANNNQANNSVKADTKKADSSNVTARTDTRTSRRYSYEPGSVSTGSSRSRSSTPLYLVPKSLR